MAHRPASTRHCATAHALTTPSVVVATLQELDSICLHEIDAAVLLRNAARPEVGAEVFQGFGMADAREGIPKRGLDEIDQAFGRPAFGVDPMAQVFDKLGVEYGNALSFTLQDRIAPQGSEWTSVAALPSVPWRELRAGARRSWGI